VSDRIESDNVRGPLGEAEWLILQTLRTQLPLNDPVPLLIFTLRSE
jgi:hypothetical protein